MNYIEIIGGIVGGSGLATLIQYFRDSKKDKSEETFKVLDEYKKLIDEHKSTINELKETEKQCRSMLQKHEEMINEMRNTISDLRNKMVQLEVSNNDFPFPCWFKDMDHTMVWLNPAYIDLILKPNHKTELDYIGKTDIDVWGEEVGKAYQKSDKKSMKYKGGVIVEDEVIIIDGEDLSNEWKVIKWVRFLGRTPIGYCGAAIPVLSK